MGPSRRLFAVLYAASGAAALVYEVTWTRLLTLQLGHTVNAASIVLAAFMGGLALGAWLAGRYVRTCRWTPARVERLASRAPHTESGRRADPALRTYAALEIVV